MADLTLYCMPDSCSRATMIALEEAGASYEARLTNLMKGEQRAPGYLSLNPRGKVPVLVAGGVALTENVAILGWIADRYPEARLLPADPMDRAQALSAVGWLASAVLTAFARIIRPERICDREDAAEAIRAKAMEEVRTQLAIAEAAMAGREWWVGRYSVADPYLYYIVCNATGRFGLDPAATPALAAHRARMERRPATQRMIAWEAKARAAMEG